MAFDAQCQATDEGRSTNRPLTRGASKRSTGLAQLSLIEHALCPLDDRLSLVEPLLFETGYLRFDRHRHPRWIEVKITAHKGLSASDEFFLWGLLALTFAQPNPSFELWATPHWCLKQLGCLQSKGGSTYAQFRRVLERLAGTTYFCKRFWDPVRSEDRDRAFGFLKYDLPLSDDTSRAYRIVWDPLFFEYCQAVGGKLAFDLNLYRQLDPASRRLFLLLSKVFHRRTHSPRFDVHHLAVHGLGFHPSTPMRNLKQKLRRCVLVMARHGIVRLSDDGAIPFEKKATGSYALTLERGPYFERPADATRHSHAALVDSPLYDPLKAIGFEERMIRWIVKQFARPTVQVWADITLAAMERHGQSFFTRSPQAYFLDNVKEAAQGKRTPPDWWRELSKRRREEAEALQREAYQAEQEEYRKAWDDARRKAFKRFVVENVSPAEYERRVRQFADIFSKTMEPDQALEAAVAEAERHLSAGFTFPGMESWTPEHHMDVPGSGES